MVLKEKKKCNKREKYNVRTGYPRFPVIARHGVTAAISLFKKKMIGIMILMPET
jgi:hypothetical protein